MERLPIDTIESIVKFLSPKDVSNCSAVNYTWRNVFNNDICWNKFYNRRFVHYLENTKCLVQPVFSNEVLNGPLSPPNKGKLCYLRENHLQNNWLCGRYERRDVVVESEADKVQFYENNYIYFFTDFQVEFWDVTNEPTRIICVPLIIKVSGPYDTKLMAKGEKLIVIQHNCVQVFNISLITKSWTFAYCFFFNKSSEFASNITHETYIRDIFKESFSGIRGCEVVICGSYVIGIGETKSNTNPVIHIWDMETRQKVNEVQCQGPWGHKVHNPNLEAFEGKRNVLVTCKVRDNSWYNVYNLCKMMFLMEWECVKYYTTNIVVSGNYVCKVDDSKLQGACYVDEQDILHPNTTMFYTDDMLDVRNESLDHERLLISSGKKVFVLNMTSGVMDTLFEADDDIENFTLIRGNYLAVNSVFNCSAPFSRHMYIWHFGLSKASKQVVAFKIGEFLAVNDVGSKIVYEGFKNRLIIVTFW